MSRLAICAGAHALQLSGRQGGQIGGSKALEAGRCEGGDLGGGQAEHLTGAEARQLRRSCERVKRSRADRPDLSGGEVAQNLGG